MNNQSTYNEGYSCRNESCVLKLYIHVYIAFLLIRSKYRTWREKYFLKQYFYIELTQTPKFPVMGIKHKIMEIKFSMILLVEMTHSLLNV
jgi:hypothetical protein